MNPRVTIESIDQEGRGVARIDDKVTFIDGALPGEVVDYRLTKRKTNFDLAEIVRIVRPSADRVVPRCRFFGVCGGCSFQHLETAAQVAVKQRMLEEQLLRIGRVQPEQILEPIRGLDWGYRHRARLSVRYVRKKEKMLVGFRERHSTYVADMNDCHILPRRFADLLVPLAKTIESLSIPERAPQIELLVDDEKIGLVLRHLEPLTPGDLDILTDFGRRFDVHWFLQPGGPATVAPLRPDGVALMTYRLDDFDLSLDFAPTNFTQINPAVNRVLVRTAMGLLRAKPGQRIADFFCGLGNFTLPIARLGASVVGFEGSEALVDRAKKNAEKNGLSDRLDAFVQNLFEVDDDFFVRHGPFDAALIDPPREGAIELVKALPETGFDRIVYVSCHAATLARDAAVLTQVKGYRLRKAGLANMFPHTGHFESIALFTR